MTAAMNVTRTAAEILILSKCIDAKSYGGMWQMLLVDVRRRPVERIQFLCTKKKSRIMETPIKLVIASRVGNVLRR